MTDRRAPIGGGRRPLRPLSADRVTVRVPASSANLGVGYDVLALALDLPLTVTVETADAGEHAIEVHGEGAGRIGFDDGNRFVTGLWRGLLDIGASWPGALRLTMHNEIPLGRGLGSSAAATVAGLLAAVELAGVERDDGRLLALATDIEGHPDNAAAALFGGFVVVAGGRVARHQPPPRLHASLFVPDQELATEDMRAVLPETVAHADAVHNMGRAAMLVSGFATADVALLWAMNDDRLHEPYRATAFPALPSLVAAARDAGALGAALSGAGSSVIALCRDATSAVLVGSAMAAAARMFELPGAPRTLRPAGDGARVVG